MSFCDHKVTKQSQDHRKLNTIWFGDGVAVKAKAYKQAVEMVSV